MYDKQPGEKVVQTLCRMCDEHCSINVHLKNGKINRVSGFDRHPYNRGILCPKGRAIQDLVYAPDRILAPMKRVGKDWQEISLEQALDEIAEKMLAIIKKYGARSVGLWKGEAVGFAQQEWYVRRFCHALGTPNYFSNDSQCFTARLIAQSLVMGAATIPDFNNAKCIVLWGANPPNTQPSVFRMIMKAKRKGAKVIVIDPRLSTAAKSADYHLRIKPGTDGALAWGISRILINNNRYDQQFVKEYSVGFEKFADYAERFTAEFVSRETGVSIDLLEKIAALMGRNAPQVASYTGNPLEHHENGVNNIRAISCLDGLLGSLDQKGGNLLPEPLKLNNMMLYSQIPLRHLGPIGVDKYPALYDFWQECHTMTAMDAMLTGEPYPLRAMIITAANPALTNANSLKVKKAMQNLELLVVRDLFMTETAGLAQYFLPAATFLERSELFTHSMFNLINLTRKVVSFPLCQDEYQFWHDLAHRLGIGSYFPWKDESEVNRWLLEPTGLSVEMLEGCPEGYRYKEKGFRKWQDQPLATTSGKFEFSSAYLKEKGYPEIPEYSSPSYLVNKTEKFPYTLITGARKLRYFSSRYHNLQSFSRFDSEAKMELNIKDAEELGIKEGEIVRVTSSIGSIEIKAHVVALDEILPGFVQITHGWGAVNVNRITPDAVNDPISGFPLLKGVPIRIERL